MTSRQHHSEVELATLGCNRLAGCHQSSVLIGGLGMGYTLRQVVNLLTSDSKILVVELLPDVAEWNQSRIGHLADHPLRDARVTMEIGDVARRITASKDEFDTILLDVDNGPDALAHQGNARLYSRDGIQACSRALHDRGALAVWSAASDKGFERRLQQVFPHVRRYRSAAYPGSRTQNRFIWVASRDRRALPAGGGEPRPLFAAPAPNKTPQNKRTTSRWK